MKIFKLILVPLILLSVTINWQKAQASEPEIAESYYSVPPYSSPVNHPLSFYYIRGYCLQNGLSAKCNSSAWGNTGFVSNNILKSSTNGEIEVTVKEIDKVKAVGLGTLNTNNHYNSMLYAVYQNGNELRIFESGSLRAIVNGLRISDKLLIKKIGTQITYYHNGRLVYTSRTPVAQDMHVLGATYTDGALLQEIEVNFSADSKLYSQASIYQLPDQINWTRLYNYAGDQSTNRIVSSTSAAHTLSENSFSTVQGSNPVIIEPDISTLFENAFRSRLSVAVGIKQYTVGDFLTSSLGYTDMLCGFIFERTRDGTPELFVRDGSRLINLGAFDANTTYRIRIENSVVNFEKGTNNRYQRLYSVPLTANQEFVVYQGSVVAGSPFLKVNNQGLSATNKISYAYLSEGNEDLISTHHGDIVKAIQATGQNKVPHKVGWTNLTNINGGQEDRLWHGVIELTDPSLTGYGESVFRFSPTDSLSTSFIYLGGDVDFGVKSLKSNTLNVVSGLRIDSGQLTVINPQTSKTTNVRSGDLIGFTTTGNSTINITVNGTSAGVAQMPQGLMNLSFQVSNSGSFSSISVTNLQLVLATGGSLGEPVITQSQYRSDCGLNVNSVFRISNNSGSNSPYIPIEIKDLNTGNHMYWATMAPFPTNTIGVHIASLPIGVYEFSAFYNNHIHNQIFEVITPIRWNAWGSHATNVIFDQAQYDQTNSVSSLDLMFPSGASYTRGLNTLALDSSGSFIIPLSGYNNGIFDLDIAGIPLRLNNPAGAGATPIFGTNNPWINLVFPLDPSTYAIKLRILKQTPTSSKLFAIGVLPFGNEVAITNFTINHASQSGNQINLDIKSHTNQSSPFRILQSTATVCPDDPPGPLLLDPESFGYGIMKRDYDAGFYVARDELRFQFTEDYYVGSGNLEYKIYDPNSDDITAQCTYTPVIAQGDNRYMLDLSSLCTSLQLNKQYRLEVKNSKSEKRVLRFLYIN